MRRLILFIIIGFLAVAGIFLAAFYFLFTPAHSQVFSSSIEMPPQGAGFVLISPDFTNGNPIPKQFTCDGENIPPTLAWGVPPAGTKSLILVMKDPDAPAGPWIHWIVYNLPPETGYVSDMTRPGLKINDNVVLFGKNSWGKQTYGGPCPPSGTHHYVFQINALEIFLGPKDDETITQLNAQMQGSILATAELTGTYSK